MAEDEDRTYRTVSRLAGLLGLGLCPTGDLVGVLVLFATENAHRPRTTDDLARLVVAIGGGRLSSAAPRGRR